MANDEQLFPAIALPHVGFALCRSGNGATVIREEGF
jgi:hypothetical protein